MGVRGELFSARVRSNNDRRTYFFNLKENRNRDLFLTVAESKKQEGSDEFERHQIVVFEDDLANFERGLQAVLDYIRENRRPGAPHRREDGSRSTPRNDRR